MLVTCELDNIIINWAAGSQARDLLFYPLSRTRTGLAPGHKMLSDIKFSLGVDQVLLVIN